MRVRWRSIAVSALVIASGAVALGSGMTRQANAAVGDCTASPPPTTSSSVAPSTTPPPGGGVGSVVVTGAGAGGGPHVAIWDDLESPLLEFYAYTPTFTGGVAVAAGDVDGDGFDDVVTAAGPGGGPHVRVFSGAPNVAGLPVLTELGGFYAYAPSFTGGVQVAVGDVNGDNQMDIVTAPGAGGGPHVRIFDGDHVQGSTPSLALLGEFMAYAPTFTGGVSVAASDMGGGDALAEVVTGAGPGGGPHVKVLEPNGATMSGTGDGFMAFPPSFRGGVNVAADCTHGEPRIATGSAVAGASAFVFSPAGARTGGFEFGPDPDSDEPFVPRIPGVGVAIGALSDLTDPPVQLLTAVAEGDPQVQVNGPENGFTNPLGGFDAYDVPIRISLAIGFM